MHIPAKVTLVTGSAQGIGAHIAEQFQERGDKTHVVWRSDEDRGEALSEQFSHRTHQGDLSTEEVVDSLVEGILEIDGKIDHVVHCIGDYHGASLAETEPSQWRALFESNVMTSILLANAVREPLRESAGTLVFFACAGVASYKARRKCAAYSSTKSALFNFARSLALEEAPHGVRVNTISPGLIPHADAEPSTLDPALHTHVPLGRPGTLEEVARAAIWLSSPESSYVVGQDLSLAGGWLS
ncbi:MAG: NAD(P)-dependent dehydrogenase (short-subunit alcohol dehydrogenase family) [Candidatus Paceibacteria bacterium]|jgi:NAD(P)-dependent dehydrogenase (short-subunit alcohol dehydrogenase family)